MHALCRRSFLFTTLSISFLALGMAPPAWGQVTPLKSNERIVFMGDANTQAGEQPNGFLSLLKADLAKMPQFKKVQILGSGVKGNKVPDLEDRLDNDVIILKPTLVVLYIGVNDVWHEKSGRGTKKDVYEEGLRRIIKRITAAGARVILCTPGCMGEKVDGTNLNDEMLEVYCAITRKVATDTKSQLLDLRKLFLEFLRAKNIHNNDSGVLTTDGVHLTDLGNRFLGQKMLEAIGATVRVETRKLRHFVAFKFKDDTPPEQVTAVVNAFAALPGKIDAITEFEHGTDVSTEMKADGYTHAFLVTFADEKGREVYLPHPAHKEFGKLVGPHIDKVFVFDYWTK